MDTVYCLKSVNPCHRSNVRRIAGILIITVAATSLSSIYYTHNKRRLIQRKDDVISIKKHVVSATVQNFTDHHPETNLTYKVGLHAQRPMGSKLLVSAIRKVQAFLPRTIQNTTVKVRLSTGAIHTRDKGNNFSVFFNRNGISKQRLESHPLHRKYLKRLRSVPRRNFAPSQNFIHYGKPVGTVQLRNSNRIKVILTWTTFEGEKNWIPKRIVCPRENVTCIGSANRSDLLISDAVVIHPRDLDREMSPLPPLRLPHQRWVHYMIESPHFAWLKFPPLEGVFNWTATFRKDTDIPRAYVTVTKRSSPMSESDFAEMFRDIYKSKTKLVSHMNSNCWTPHTTRLDYVRELQYYIPVYTYGECGVYSCPRNTSICEKTMKQYKFYMAMENSNCRDYITEKAAEPLLLWGAVPIVMGGADPGDYERLLPPGSYINTDGFDSPKQLAEYLRLLDKSPSLYQEYHRWRVNYTVGIFSDAFWCNMCVKLYNMSLPIQTYHDFMGWYHQDTCRADPDAIRP